MPALLALLVLLLTRQILVGQEGEEIPLIRYTPEFRFSDGIYLSIDDVKTNNPIPLARIVSDRVEYDKDFFDGMVRTAFYSAMPCCYCYDVIIC